MTINQGVNGGTINSDTVSDAIINNLADIKAVGGVSNGSTDNTVAIQNYINYFASIGGGVVTFPIGSNSVYVVKGTLIMKKNVTLEGYANTNIQNNNSSITISHEPTIAGTDLFIGDTPQINGYLGGISIKNLNLRAGNNNCRYACKIDKASNLLVEKVIISKVAGTNGFIDGFVIDGYIQSKFKECYFRNCSNSPIRFTGGISTTVVFDQCYSTTSNWALIIEERKALGVVFNACIFESCSNGLDVHVDNKVDFINCYSEDNPTNSSAKAIMQLGINGIPETPGSPELVVNIIGGNLAGCNTGIDADSAIFNCNHVKSLTVMGTNHQRAGKLIKTTINTLNVSFVGVSLTQVTSRSLGIFNPSKVIFLGVNENGVSMPWLEVSRINFTGGNGAWKILDRYRTTDSDLDIINGHTGNIVTSFDAQDNIKHNFSGESGNASGVDMFGAIPTPTFVNTGLGAFLWAETINNSIVLRTRDSSGLINNLDYFVSTTVGRPTVGNRVGRNGFDTTLNIPIWRNNAGDWVNSVGATV